MMYGVLLVISTTCLAFGHANTTSTEGPVTTVSPSKNSTSSLTEFTPTSNVTIPILAGEENSSAPLTVEDPVEPTTTFNFTPTQNTTETVMTPTSLTIPTLLPDFNDSNPNPYPEYSLPPTTRPSRAPTASPTGSVSPPQQIPDTTATGMTTSSASPTIKSTVFLRPSTNLASPMLLYMIVFLCSSLFFISV